MTPARKSLTISMAVTGASASASAAIAPYSRANATGVTLNGGWRNGIVTTASCRSAVTAIAPSSYGFVNTPSCGSV
jgi:hypothetical protein